MKKKNLILFISLAWICSLHPVWGFNKPSPKKILVTAFGPYAGLPINPSETIMNLIRTSAPSNQKTQYTFATLRVAYSSVDSFITYTPFQNYHMIVMLGLMPNSVQLRVETTGNNYSGPSKDIDSVSKAGLIQSRSPQKIILAQPYVQQIEKYIHKKRPPMVISSNAGSYVCNYLVYNIRYLFMKKGYTQPALFIHVADTLTRKNIMTNEQQALHILDLMKHMIKKLP